MASDACAHVLPYTRIGFPCIRGSSTTCKQGLSCYGFHRSSRSAQWQNSRRVAQFSLLPFALRLPSRSPGSRRAPITGPVSAHLAKSIEARSSVLPRRRIRSSSRVSSVRRRDRAAQRRACRLKIFSCLGPTSLVRSHAVLRINRANISKTSMDRENCISYVL